MPKLVPPAEVCPNIVPGVGPDEDIDLFGLNYVTLFRLEQGADNLEAKAISIEEKTSSDNNNDDETLSQSSVEGNFQCKNKNK